MTSSEAPGMAAPDGSRDTVPPAPASPATGVQAASSAIRTLRLLVVGTILVPLLLAAVGGYLSYLASYQRATAALGEAAAVAEENTTKILDTHMLVAARIEDLLRGLGDAEIRDREQQLHDRIAQQIKDLPQVAAAWVIDAQGHELVSARVYPVNRDLDQSSRDDFQALQKPDAQTFIWALRARSLDRGDYQPYFTVSRRLPSPDGGFGGIVVVAVSGNYFASFYNSLLGASEQYTASVLREDGTTLARYPETAPPAPPPRRTGPLAQAIAAKETSGVIDTGSPLRDDGSIIAFKRLANYPVYVAVGRTRASILRAWLVSMAGYAAIGTLAAIGLMLLSLMALRRTRREQTALAQARDAIVKRAAVEAQLHQAQKMEAVGLLTAGIAHDFNNLLTVVSGNMALLKADLEGSDARRHKLIGSAITACERAASLTKRLLGFARREPIDPRPVEVNEVITGLSELPWRSLGDRIATEFRLSGGIWPVFVDPNQLENALLNLALNARDAMAGRGSLTIETVNCSFDESYTATHPGATAGDYVAILVGDTGVGMPQEVRDKAFDPFFTTKQAGKGSGLGLAQVYGFVTRFGGHCTLESEPGRGTTVKLYLPRYSGAAAGMDGGGDAATDAIETARSAAPLPFARRAAASGGD